MLIEYPKRPSKTPARPIERRVTLNLTFIPLPAKPAKPSQFTGGFIVTIEVCCVQVRCESKMSRVNPSPFPRNSKNSVLFVINADILGSLRSVSSYDDRVSKTIQLSILFPKITCECDNLEFDHISQSFGNRNIIRSNSDLFQL